MKMTGLLLLLGSMVLAVQPAPSTLRVGIIGLDTSHVTAFTQIFNNPKNEGDLAGLRVVAAYPGGSPDVKSSRDRVEGFTRQLKEKFGVEIVGSVEDVIAKSDVVLLESVDGRKHLEQALPILKAGKKVFIDKPLGGSLADVVRIFDLARTTKTPVFSSSGLRFAAGIAGMKQNAKIGKILGCDAFSPCALEEHHADLFWYGIHGVETLYTIMGPGCKSVTRIHNKDTDVVTGLWHDGRVGTFRGLRTGKQDYGARVFGSAGIGESGGFGGYEPLAVAVARFLKTGEPPVSAEETLEIYTFMEAADESKRQGGVPVALDGVLQKARTQK